MLQQFLKYIETNQLIELNQPVLLAISGGIDSMCMLHLFHTAKIPAAIAHCNFGLRGNESDEDEQFVKDSALKYQMPFFSKKFNTLEYARLEKVNIQIAARELRYNWFENLRRVQNFSVIAIAHNADDSIETFFINLLRGTGIQGIGGIKNRVNSVIRPLLFAHRSDIEHFCTIQNVNFRTDSTNLTDKYLRNKLRNNILPLLHEIKSDFRETMIANLNRFAEAATIYDSFIQNESRKLLQQLENECFEISIPALEALPAPKTVLFELLKQFGVSSSLNHDIFSNLHSESGKTYFTETHRILKNRNTLIVNKLNISEEAKYYIDSDCSLLEKPIKLHFETKHVENFVIPREKNIAALDAEKLCFPLVLRKWQQGDYFKPLGMNGFKKLSDFFIDNKLSLVEKENLWILASADDIVWIVGMRPDDRFKINAQTTKICVIKYT